MFVITGIMAAGKSTVAQALAERFDRSVHLRGDTFRRFVVSGRVEMSPDPSPEAMAQLELRYELAATCADRYVDAGFLTVMQDVILGRPILPEEIGALGLKERKELVIGAINALHPTNDVEEPFPGDPAFAERLGARLASTNTDEPHGVLLEVLRERTAPHDFIRRLVAADGGTLEVGDDPQEQWLAELARRVGVRTRTR